MCWLHTHTHTHTCIWQAISCLKIEHVSIKKGTKKKYALSSLQTSTQHVIRGLGHWNKVKKTKHKKENA